MRDSTYGNQDTTGTPLRRIVPGEPVYDVNGDKVGTVSEYDGQSSYFTLHKGIIFTHNLYVPTSVITHSDADGMYLKLTKDDITDQGWNNPPAGGMSTDTPNTDVGTRHTGVRAGEANVPAREEALRARVEHGQAGDVRLHKDVTEEQQTMDVLVTHEEVRVERVSVDDQQAAGNLGPDAFTEKDVDVPLMGERVNVEKRARVGEEVRLHKRPVTERQHVSGTVRKERVRVEGADGQDTTAYETPDQQTTTDTPLP